MQRPTAMGPYTLGRRLGRGAFAEVHAGVHRTLGTEVALKRLHPERATHFLLDELDAIAQVEHPAVVALFDVGVQDGVHWLAMERCRTTLAHAPVDDLRVVLRGILAGLGAIHARGLLHLDLKPSNVLVRDDGSICLADFGIARRIGSDSPSPWGTPGYVAPEVADGRTALLGPATDLFAVGALAWALLVGRPPTGPVPVVPADRPIDPATLAWITRLLAPRPADRPASAAEAATTLPSGDGPPTVGHPAPTATVPLAQRTLTAPTAADPVPWTPLPEAWPIRRRRRSRRGMGTLTTMVPPWHPRPEAQADLWEVARAAIAAGGGVIRVAGGPGVGRTRFVQEAVQVLAAATGALAVGPDDDPWNGVRRSLGDDPVGLAVRLRVPLDVARAWCDDGPTATWEVLDAMATRHPLVIGTENPAPTLPGAVVVQGVDRGPADVHLKALPADATRATLADWSAFAPADLAALVARAQGDLATCVDTLSRARREGTLHETPRGWSIDAAPTRLHGLDRWTDWTAGLPVTDPAFAATAVRETPGDGDPDAARQLERADLTRDGVWVGAVARRAVERSLPDPAAAHRVVAADLAVHDDDDAWERGTHLLQAGDVQEARPLLLANAWRTLVDGRMAHVDQVLRQLAPTLATLPANHPDRGNLARAQALLGTTHQGVEAVDAAIRAGLELARIHGDSDPEWAHVERRLIGSALFQADVELDPSRADGLQARIDRLGAHDDPYLVQLQGWVHLRGGDPHTCWALAVRTFELADPATARGVHLRRLAPMLACIASGHLDRSGVVERYRQVSAAFLAAGYQSAAMDIAFTLGDLHRWAGDLPAAADHYAEAIDHLASGEVRGDASPWIGLARTRLAQGATDRALELLGAAAEQLGTAGPVWRAVTTLTRLEVEQRAGQAMDEAALASVVDVLRQTRFIDRDVAASLGRLACSEACARALARHMEKTLERSRRQAASAPVVEPDGLYGPTSPPRA